MRVVIFTGSRALPLLACEAQVNGALDDGAWVFYGDCPTGLDEHVNSICKERMHERRRRFVADWGKHGRAAGPIRNKEMVQAAWGKAVELGCALWCIAYPMGASRGTRGCIKLAEELASVIVHEVKA